MATYVITYNIYSDGKITGGGYLARSNLEGIFTALDEEMAEYRKGDSVIVDIVVKEFK